MSSADDVVKKRLAAVLLRSNIPTWVDTTELQAELFKVVSRLLKAECFAARLSVEVERAFDEQVDRDRGLIE